MKTKHKKGLKAYRVAQGHKLMTLAPLLGIPMSCLSQIENGKQMPSLALLRKYADVFGITVYKAVDLYGESEKERDKWSEQHRRKDN